MFDSTNQIVFIRSQNHLHTLISKKCIYVLTYHFDQSDCKYVALDIYIHIKHVYK